MKVYTGIKTGHIPGLNALRFLGALSVIFLHLGSSQFFLDLGLENYHRLISGNTGVILFYVLSGFLITSLAIDEVTKNGSFNIIYFLQRRSLRLFPLYYLALLVIFMLSFFGVTRISDAGWLYAVFYAFN